MKRSVYIQIGVLFFLLVVIVWGYDDFKGYLYEIAEKGYLIANSGYAINLPLLTWQHIVMSFWACCFSILIGGGLGTFAASQFGKEFKVVIEKITSFSNALPAIGILGIFIPIFGFGVTPGAIVLVIGGTMPIVFSTIAGLENVPKDLLEVGSGLGMNQRALFWRVKIPTAFPIILAGIRTASIIIIGAATLSAVSGAGGLGIPIFSAGIRGFDPIALLEGAIPVTLLALLVDKVFQLLEMKAKHRFGTAKGHRSTI